MVGLTSLKILRDLLRAVRPKAQKKAVKTKMKTRAVVMANLVNVLAVYIS